MTGAGALSAIGNGLDNHLIGNSGANKLIGNDGNDTLDGGAGGDSMAGGTATTSYFVNARRQGGRDRRHRYGYGPKLDHLQPHRKRHDGEGRLREPDPDRPGAINGTGNAFNNVIHGNDAVNKLDGGGGDDTITGHGGNDQIDVGNGNDTVSFVSTLDGHDMISNFDGDATGGQDTVDLDALFDSLSIAAPTAPGASPSRPASVTSMSVSTSARPRRQRCSHRRHAQSGHPADAITVGQDVLVGT